MNAVKTGIPAMNKWFDPNGFSSCFQLAMVDTACIARPRPYVHVFHNPIIMSMLSIISAIPKP